MKYLHYSCYEHFSYLVSFLNSLIKDAIGQMVGVLTLNIACQLSIL